MLFLGAPGSGSERELSTVKPVPSDLRGRLGGGDARPQPWAPLSCPLLLLQAPAARPSLLLGPSQPTAPGQALPPSWPCPGLEEKGEACGRERGSCAALRGVLSGPGAEKALVRLPVGDVLGPQSPPGWPALCGWLSAPCSPGLFGTRWQLSGEPAQVSGQLGDEFTHPQRQDTPGLGAGSRWLLGRHPPLAFPPPFPALYPPRKEVPRELQAEWLRT